MNSHEERIERARKAGGVNRQYVETIVAAYLGDTVLYEEPNECLHRYLSDYRVCDDCNAEQRWVIQVYPEVKE